MKPAGEQAIEAVTESGDHKNHQRPTIMSIHQMDDNKRHKNHSQQGELVGRGKNLRELHARSLELSVCCAPIPRTAEGSRRVFDWKRCESDGRLPSGRSSSTRSMRCMGKNTTAGVNGSPSRTITVRSSKDASSAP